MKNLLVILIIIYSSMSSFGQKQGNIWYFGDSVGIDFNGNVPVPLTDGLLGTEVGSSAVSDKNGNLLFYDGDKNEHLLTTTIFNRQQQIMMNGDSLYGGYATAQATIILPFPGDSERYFLFTLVYDIAANDRLAYSIINMNLDNGLGGVEQKNIMLGIDSLTQMMTAVRHANGRDWWLIVHKYTSNEFIEYLISPDGISGPYSQNIGESLILLDSQGGMVFSQDGTKLCLASFNNHLEVLDFDRCTGILSNVRVLNNVFGLYSCSFSPNGKVLYASNFQSLYQYDLTASNISNSMQTIYTVTPSDYWIGQHKLAPDKKIYVGITYHGMPNNIYDTITMNLSVINYPDSLGQACHFAPYSFNLGGRRTYGGLPNIPNYGLGASPTLVVDSAKAGNDTTICQSQSAIIGSPAKTGCLYSWNPASGLDDSIKAQPVASPTITTTYILTLTDTNNAECKFISTTTDTVIVHVTPLEKANAGTNTTICIDDSIVIGNPLINGYAYSWKPFIGINDSSISQPIAKPTQTTTYILTLIDTANTACRNVATTSEVVVTLMNCYVNKIYPNPANDNLNIEYNVSSSGIFQIYDVLGQMALSIPLEGLYGIQTINISNIGNGIYYWKINSNTEQIRTGKIAIIH